MKMTSFAHTIIAMLKQPNLAKNSGAARKSGIILISIIPGDLLTGMSVLSACAERLHVAIAGTQSVSFVISLLNIKSS